MRFLATLFLGATCSLAAAAVMPPRVRHLGDFRGWDGVDCGQGYSKPNNNLGIWTVLEDEIVGGPCKDFNGQSVWSLRLEDIEPDCSLYVFSGPECTIGRQVQVKTCISQQGGFTGWKMACGKM